VAKSAERFMGPPATSKSLLITHGECHSISRVFSGLEPLANFRPCNFFLERRTQ
jgi:hypothetical protein